RDPAWAGLPAATDFVQNTPDEGQPASERTEVFLGFDADTLYVGVVCFDRDPDSIVISDSRRDASLLETDSFQIFFDTYGDQQTGFIFGTNPSGLQYDGQVSEDGRDFNLNWDGAFEVEARVFDGGWSAEFAIPFRTLRFPNGEQAWGLNFQRNIRRRNERSYWAALPRQFGLDRASLAGRLEGLEVPRQRLLQITPYALVEAEEGRDGSPDRDENAEFGFDLKYGLTPSLTLDATYNTDFAQVEADVQQVNLDRFNLFFPEKRPFFLENAGAFSVGVPQEVELFFSRRIGLGAGGQNIPIDGGLRLTGKAGRTNVGLLYMATDDVGDLPGSGDEFGVVRISQDLGDRSSVGFIATRRDGDRGDDDRGRTYGVDGRWGVTQQLEILAFAAKTDTPGVDDDDHAFRVGGRWDSEAFSAGLNYTEVGDGFNPEVGFLARRGFRKADGFVFVRHRPKDLWGLQEMRPHITYRGFWDFDGFQETGYLHVDNHWEWKNGHEIHTGVNFTREGVKRPFEIFPGVIVPPGTYDHEEIQFVAFTNRGAAAGAEIRVIAGGFFGGDRVNATPTFRFRVGEQFNAELVWSHNDIDLPGGAFTTNLGRLRVAYSFSPEVFLEALLQYNDRPDRWSTNLRFGWRQDSSTGLFVVYNENQEIGDGLLVPERRLIVNLSRLFDLFKS
ncbi:MAG: DUF5916 domain-containing protein, partial [Acidobacteriota bacterium]